VACGGASCAGMRVALICKSAQGEGTAEWCLFQSITHSLNVGGGRSFFFMEEQDQPMKDTRERTSGQGYKRTKRGQGVFERVWRKRVCVTGPGVEFL